VDRIETVLAGEREVIGAALAVGSKLPPLGKVICGCATALRPVFIIGLIDPGVARTSLRTATAWKHRTVIPVRGPIASLDQGQCRRTETLPQRIRSLSPDSCRARRIAVTGELGHTRTIASFLPTLRDTTNILTGSTGEVRSLR